MGAASQTRKTGNAWGLAIVVGYFALLCAAVFVIAGFWRAYRGHLVDSRWIEVTARIKTCALDEDHPFSRDGGGVVYSLHCRLNYQIDSVPYESDLRTISDRSVETRDRITVWVARNPPGTILRIRMNPADPKELVVEDALPMRQFLTARDAWNTAMIFALLGFVLIAIGRVVSGRAD